MKYEMGRGLTPSEIVRRATCYDAAGDLRTVLGGINVSGP